MKYSVMTTSLKEVNKRAYEIAKEIQANPDHAAELIVYYGNECYTKGANDEAGRTGSKDIEITEEG